VNWREGRGALVHKRVENASILGSPGQSINIPAGTVPRDFFCFLLILTEQHLNIFFSFTISYFFYITQAIYIPDKM
jgi:hypothetical protein